MKKRNCFEEYNVVNTIKCLEAKTGTTGLNILI